MPILKEVSELCFFLAAYNRKSLLLDNFSTFIDFYFSVFFFKNDSHENVFEIFNSETCWKFYLIFLTEFDPLPEFLPSRKRNCIT